METHYIWLQGGGLAVKSAWKVSALKFWLPAPTTDELLELMPRVIQTDRTGIICLQSHPFGVTKNKWRAGYEPVNGKNREWIEAEIEDTTAEALGLLALELNKKGLI